MLHLYTAYLPDSKPDKLLDKHLIISDKTKTKYLDQIALNKLQYKYFAPIFTDDDVSYFAEERLHLLAELRLMHTKLSDPLLTNPLIDLLAFVEFAIENQLNIYAWDE